MSTFTLSALIWTIVKIAIMFGFVLNLAAILTWADRRQSAMIQDRVGPNRAVFKIFGKEIRLAGLLHPAADGLKFIFKEDFMPPKADKLLFGIAPILCVAAVFALLATIPFGDAICPKSIHVGQGLFDGIWPSVPKDGVCSKDAGRIDLSIAPLDVGLLYLFAMAGQGIIGAAIAGWSSDNKFSLFGALRAASQMVSYEVTLGLSLVGAMMIYQTVRLDHMVVWQGQHAWGIFVQPVAFFLFFAAAVAETKRIPFDLPEAESELVSGYFTEYSGMKFGMFYLSEYMEVVTSSMLLVTIFLGGWQLPFFHRGGLTVAFGDMTLLDARVPHLWMTLIGVLAFFGKVLLVCWIQTFIRWSLPRFRYDQLMRLGWKVLLPLSLVNIVVTGLVLLGVDSASLAVRDGLRTAGHVTQALVAAGATFLIAKAVVGFFGSREKDKRVLGSSAEEAAKAGGTKTAPMQA